jgi:ribosomal protein L21E
MKVGDRVRLILDKERSPDNQWHGKTGTITRITADAAGDVTGDELDSLLLEIAIDGVPTGEQPNIHFRYDDVELVDADDYV